MRTGFIYKYTNLVDDNHKIYVGQCLNIAHRKKAHKSAALNDSEACPLFYRAIRKYDYDSFNFEILEEIYGDQKLLDDREVYWIKELNATDNDVGYNISPGGSGRSNPNNTDTHKQCPRCKLIKSRIEEYTKAIHSHDGICFCCQECYVKIENEYRASLSSEEKERRNKIRRDKYAENPEKQLEASKKYYEEHKEERAEYKKEYYQLNKEELSAEHKIYRIEHKEELVENSKEYRNQIKVENSKLTSQQIYDKTPFKFCHGDCQKDIESNKFYIDLTRLDALARKCKECHKAKMAINREKKRNELKAAE